jgi:hypothetical protein
MALSLGFNFIPVPRPLPNLNELIDLQYEDFAKRLRTSYIFLHSDRNNSRNLLRPMFKTNVWTPLPAPDLVEKYLTQVNTRLKEELIRLNSTPNKRCTTKQYSPPWLHKTLMETKENIEITITEADKNMGTVVIKTSEYIKHSLGQLNDKNTYIACDAPPDFNQIWNNLERILIEYNRFTFLNLRGEEVPTDIRKFLLQLKDRDELQMGSFYLLMKVHKTPLAGRPIVSSTNTITYFASKYIDSKLQPIYKLIPSYVGSSQNLLIMLESVNFSKHKDCFILCADVDSLYPNIPKDKGLLMMKESILRRKEKLPPENQLTESDINLICDLMAFVLDNNYFTFGELIYKQINGTAMGTPAAVVFACLFLDKHETNVIESTNVKPLLYRRFIDDIFAVFGCKQDAETFINAFSSEVTLPTIKCSNFTISDKEGIFLDLHIFKGTRFAEKNLLDVKIYQKPQNKYLYIPLNSFHPKSVFPSYIKAEINRYRLTCTNDNDFLTVKTDFFNRLSARGYPEEFLTPIFAENQSRKNLLDTVKNRLFKDNSSVKEKRTIIFKTCYHPQIKAIKLKDCLQLTDGMKQTQVGLDLCDGKEPIICYSNPPSIRSYFSQSRKNLHALPLTHNMSLDIEDIDKLISSHKQRPDNRDSSRETVPVRVRKP